MATHIFDKDHLNEFNDFYVFLSEKMQQEHHSRKQVVDARADSHYTEEHEEHHTSYSAEIINYYQSHGIYESILEKGYANFVLAILAPPKKALNNITYNRSKELFRETMAHIAGDRHMEYNETSRIYYAHINNLEDDLNGYSKGEIMSSFKDATDNDHNGWTVRNGILYKAGQDVDRDGVSTEAQEDRKVMDIQHEDTTHREHPVEERRAVTTDREQVVVADERPALDKKITKKIILYHMDSFGVKNGKEFRNIMEGKSLALFVVSLLVGLVLLSLMVIYRNTLAYGDNPIANALQAAGDALQTSPMIILFALFFILLMVITIGIFNYARFYEKRKLFLRNTPILIKALDVDEATFNDIIDEKFYDEKVKLKKRTFK